MGISDNIIEKTRKYIETKNYNYDLVNSSKTKQKQEKSEIEYLKYNYSVGDKVKLLDKNETAIVYKELDELNNLIVFYKDEFIEVNYTRVKLELEAIELYPEGYDLNQLFVSYL